MSRLSVSILTAMLFSATLSFSAYAVTGSYFGSQCQVMDSTKRTSVSKSGGTGGSSGTGGSITANADGIEVVCPIVKTTSGPWIYNDQLTGAQVVQNSPSAGGVSCNLVLYRAHVELNVSNVLGLSSAASTSSGTTTLSLDGFSWDTAWDMWAYAALECTLQNGARIDSYSVGEAGSIQTGYAIYSPAHCVPTAGSSYLYYRVSSIDGTGGYWETKQMSGFSANCAVGATATGFVQVSAGPSIDSSGVAQLTVTNGVETKTVPQNPGTVPPGYEEWPSRYLSLRFPTSGGTLSWNGTGSVEGDGKILSFRTQPSLAAGKSVSQTNTDYGGAPELAVDNSTDGIYSHGSVTHTQYGLTSWRVDLGATFKIGEVVIWNRSDCCSDRLTNFDVELSDDGTTWVETLNVPGQAGFPTIVNFAGTLHRWLRIKLKSASWLSLAEVQVYQNP